VHRGVTEFLRRLAEHQARAKVCIVEVLAAGPKAIARRDAAIRGFTFFIDEGRGETSAELPAFTALATLGGLNEILYTNILNGRTAELPRLAPDFVYWIHAAVPGLRAGSGGAAAQPGDAERRMTRCRWGGLRPQAAASA